MMCWSLAQFSVLYPSSFESKLRAGLLEPVQQFLRQLVNHETTYAPSANKHFFTTPSPRVTRIHVTRFPLAR